MLTDGETSQAKQVEQFLLSHGFHLTALELLVESAGAGEQFPELENFFQDQKRFPADEIARHSHTNALDLQAQAREREQRLQLSEYELRLAKEDLADMNRKMCEAQSHASAAKQEQQQLLASQQGLDSVHPAGSQSPAASKSANRLQEQEGQQTRSHPIGDLGMAPATRQDTTATFDWSRVGEPTADDFKEINSSMVAFLVWQGLKTSALTLREEAGCEGGDARAARPVQPQQHPGLALWRWYQLARSPLAHQGLETLAAEASTEAVAAQAAASEHARVESLQELLAQAQAEADAARKQAATLAQDAAELRVKLEALQVASMASEDRPKATSNHNLEKTGAAGAKDQLEEQELQAVDQEEVQQQHKHVLALATIVNQLTELLPRIMPALTIKSRLEMLPMVQTIILATLDPETQRVLVGLVFNGVATPDPSQRSAVVGLCAGVAAALGPTWAAQEVLSMCTKQASSPSTERRVLVAEQLHALLNPGEPAALIDLSVTSHTLLPQLHRLAEDRMEQVREAALRGLITLLGPNRLSFSRHYYVMLEELLVQLVRDGVEGISQAAISSFLPSLQAWAASGGEEDLLISSLLPRVISDVGRHVRQGAAAITPPQVFAQAGNSSAFQGSSLQYTRTPEGAGAPGSANQPSPSARGSLTPPGLMPRNSFGLASMHHSAASFNVKRFACFDYQAAHQLLEVYCILQPTLRECALHKCPACVVDAAITKSTAAATGGKSCRQQEDQDARAVVGGGARDRDTEEDESGGRDCAQEEMENLSQLPVPDDVGEQQDDGDGKTLQRSNTGVQMAQPSSAARHQRSFSVGTPGSLHQRCLQQKRQPELSTCRSMDGLSSRASLAVEAAAAWPSAAEQGTGVADALELVQSGVCSLNDLLLVWLRLGERHIQWKAIQWVVQFLLPELLDAANALPGPPPPSPTSHLETCSSSLAGTNNSPAQPASDEQLDSSELRRSGSFGEGAGPVGGGAEGGSSIRDPRDPGKEVRLQLARALQTMADVFGSAFSRSVLLPICSAAAGTCNGGPVPDDPSPQTVCFVGADLAPQVLEAAQDVRPSSPDAAMACRLRMLPLLLGSVLPACGEGKLSSWLVFVSNNASHPTNRWLGDSLQEMSRAVFYACILREGCMLEIMQVLEHMVGQSAQGISSEMGLLGLTLVRGVLPVAGARDHLARRIMPFVMVLLSNGDVEMQLACVEALLEVLLRYWGDTKLVEQVLVVYDGLLEQSPHEVQCAVLGAGQRLAKAVAPKATHSPAAAGQLEWLLQASQSMALQLCSAPDTPEQKRLLASQLAHVLHTIHVQDVRLPRLQSALQTCAETLQRNRALLPEEQHAAVHAVTNSQATAKAGSTAAAAHSQQQQQQQQLKQAAVLQQVALQQDQQYQQQAQQQLQQQQQQQQQQQSHVLRPPTYAEPRVPLAAPSIGPLSSIFSNSTPNSSALHRETAFRQHLQQQPQQQQQQQQQSKQQQQQPPQGEESSFSSRFQRFKSRFRRGGESQQQGPPSAPPQQPPVINMPSMNIVVGPPQPQGSNQQQQQPQQPQQMQSLQQNKPPAGSVTNGVAAGVEGNGQPHLPWLAPRPGDPDEGGLPLGTRGTHFLGDSDDDAL